MPLMSHARSPLHHPAVVHPGDVVADRFEVVGILRRERGLLLDVLHLGVGRRVVLRLTSPALLSSHELARLQRETQVLASLESEHVARVHDAGILPDGSFYVVREHVDGEDLLSMVTRRRLAVHEALTVIAQIGEAVQEAHARGIALRGLSPRDIRVTKRRSGERVAKITDMPTGKALGAGSGHTLTGAGGISPWVAPEATGSSPRADRRTDLWSLGAILYACLAGRPPFDGSDEALMRAITREPPPSLLRSRPDVPIAVDRAIAWCLTKEPDGRPPSVHALLHTLFDHAPPAAQLTIDRAARLSSGPCEVMTPVLPPFVVADDRDDESAAPAVPAPAASQVRGSWVRRALGVLFT